MRQGRRRRTTYRTRPPRKDGWRLATAPTPPRRVGRPSGALEAFPGHARTGKRIRSPPQWTRTGTTGVNGESSHRGGAGEETAEDGPVSTIRGAGFER